MIYNLTPHPVVIMTEDKEIRFTIPPDGRLPRVEQIDSGNGAVAYGDHLVEVVVTSYGEVSGLPDPEPQVYYIVSALTAQAAQYDGRHTWDLLLPSNLVRDDAGRVIGCTRFAGLPA